MNFPIIEKIKFSDIECNLSEETNLDAKQKILEYKKTRMSYNNRWNSFLENVVTELANKSQIMKIKHELSAKSDLRYSKWFAIGIFCFSLFIGTLLCFKPLIPVNCSDITWMDVVAALMVYLLGGVNRMVNINNYKESANNHLSKSMSYDELFSKIRKVLASHRSDRPVAGEFVDDVHRTFNNIKQRPPVVDDSVDTVFEKKYASKMNNDHITNDIVPVAINNFESSMSRLNINKTPWILPKISELDVKNKTLKKIKEDSYRKEHNENDDSQEMTNLFGSMQIKKVGDTDDLSQISSDTSTLINDDYKEKIRSVGSLESLEFNICKPDISEAAINTPHSI